MIDLRAKLRSGDPLRAADVLTAIDESSRALTELRGIALEAFHRAQADSDGGFKPSTLGGGRGATTIVDEDGNPCEVHDHAVAERIVNQQEHPDLIAIRAREMVAGIDRAHKAVAVALAAAHSLRALSPKAAKRLAEAIAGSNVGTCTNCTRLVAGTRDDRLKAGRCDACYEYRRTHDGAERPKDLWEKAS